MNSRTTGKLPIFTATKSLKSTYLFADKDEEKISATVSGSALHAMLHAKVNWMFDVRTSLLDKENLPVYKTSLASLNFATAALTFLYSDTPKEEGYFGDTASQQTFYIKAPGLAIVSSYDFYTDQYKYRQNGVENCRNARDHSFNLMLEERMNAFFGVAHRYFLPDGSVTTPKNLEESISGKIFHETFHHSEQAIMHYLNDLDTLLAFTEALHKAAPEATQLHGVVLDVFTQRMLCHNCNYSLIGMQHSHEKGFLNALGTTANIFGIDSSHLMMGVRVSAERAASHSPPIDILDEPTDTGQVHLVGEKTVPSILQAGIKSLGTKELMEGRQSDITSCHATLFSSSDFSRKMLENQLGKSMSPESNKRKRPLMEHNR